MHVKTKQQEKKLGILVVNFVGSINGFASLGKTELLHEFNYFLSVELFSFMLAVFELNYPQMLAYYFKYIR